MTRRQRSPFTSNNVSKKLTDDQIKELESYYQTYHRKCWAYKQALQRYKHLELLGNSLSIIFASGGIASSIATGGISLIAISTAALLIQGWMKHQSLDLKIHNCTYAYQSYQHLLNAIKDIVRSGDYKQSSIYITMKNVDDYVADNSPIIDKYLLKYDKKFNA